MNKYLFIFLLLFGFNIFKLKAQSTDTLQTPNPDTLYAIGKQAFCGIIFYVKDTFQVNNNKADTTAKDKGSDTIHFIYGLACAPQDESPGIVWADSIVNTRATKDTLFDIENTYQIISVQGFSHNYAAGICLTPIVDSCCKDTTIACGWYLPSVVELDSMYKNLAKKGIGNFEPVGYWSSVEATTRHNSHRIFNSAYVVDFVQDGSSEDGKSRENDKSNKNRVRKIREFKVVVN